MPLPAILTSDTWILDEGLMPDLSMQSIFAHILQQTELYRFLLPDFTSDPLHGLNSYERAVTVAQFAVGQWQKRIPILPDSVARKWGYSKSYTEWAAKTLWLAGYIPGAVYADPRFYTSVQYRNHQPPDEEWLNSTPQPRHGKPETRRKCTECEEWHDLTSAHWHRDPKGRLGWQTICKDCRNEARRMDYQRSVKAA